MGGLGIEAEEKLWLQGCLCWSDYIKHGKNVFSFKKHKKVLQEIELARQAHKNCEVRFFLDRLPIEAKARVLLLDTLEVGYLDVETTGLETDAEITVAALATKNYTKVHKLFRSNQGMKAFIKSLQAVDLLVTYNGQQFDIPLIERNSGETIKTPHLDMKPVLDKQGLRGGQKRAEKMAGLKRSNPALDGEKAVQLWQNHVKFQKSGYLVELCKYCAEDTFQLQQLAHHSKNRSMTSFPERSNQTQAKRQEVLLVG